MKSGAPLGGFLEKNCSPSTVSLNRWSVTGRSPFAARKASPTSTMYRARSSLVSPRPGQTTLAGLDTRNSRSPCGPLTVRWTSSLAMGTTYPGGGDS